MGKPIKTTSGKWWVQFMASGVRDSGTFNTKREAEEWQARRKLELRAIAAGHGGDVKTLGDALCEYRDKVSPAHRGANWETLRVNAFLRHPALPCAQPLAKLLPDHIIAYRNSRLREVKPGTVARELNLLSAILNHAVIEWRWMASSPMTKVRRPPRVKHRERLISRAEIKAMLRQLGYHPGRTPDTMTAQIGYAFMIALRTGMRSSEIVNLPWKQVHPRWVTLLETKNGEARDVPLSRKAVRLFDLLRGINEHAVFMLTDRTRDALFRRARNRAGLSGFTFHDSRHTAATRIGATVGQPGRLSFPEFCKTFGWKDPRNALVYVNPTAASLAEKL